PTTVLWARSGKIVWVNGVAEAELEEGVRFQEKKGQVRVIRFAHYSFPISGIRTAAFDLSHLTVADPFSLWQRARRHERAAQAELVRRLTLPMTLPVLLAVGPWVVRPRKRGTHGWAYLGGIVATLAVYNGTFALLQLVQQQQTVWVWTPSAALGLLSIVGLTLGVRRFLRWRFR
ncbi:MAG: LptF/LptG family permease, partial [Zetaproteobacteria bacterium]